MFVSGLFSCEKETHMHTPKLSEKEKKKNDFVAILIYHIDIINNMGGGGGILRCQIVTFYYNYLENVVESKKKY